MKKLLPLVLGLSLMCISPDVPKEKSGMKSELKDYNYELFIEKLIKFKIGESNYSNDEIHLNIKKFDNLTFKKERDFYYEIAISPGREEIYKYSFDTLKKLWEFKDYWLVHLDNQGNKIENPDSSLIRKDKFDALGSIYEKDVLFATDIFEKFEGNKIPDSLDIMVFSYVYHLDLKDTAYNGNLIEANYNVLNYVQYETDIRKLDGFVKILLEREKDSTYYPFGAEVPISYKSNLLGNVRMNLLVKRK